MQKDFRIVDSTATEIELFQESVGELLEEFGRLKRRNEKIQAELSQLKKSKDGKNETIESQRVRIKELETRVKNLEKKEEVLKERVKINKEFANIVKNNKNADLVSDIDKRLNSYIDHIEDTIKLLKTL